MKKKIFKLLDDYIIIHSFGEKKSNVVLLPKLDTYREHTQWRDNINYVYDLAENIKTVSIGDKVILSPHTKLRGMEMITKIIEEKTGTKTTKNILDKDGKEIGVEEEVEKYFIIKEEDIMAVINS